MKIILLVTALLFMGMPCWGSVNKAWLALKKSRGNVKGHLKVAKYLTRSGLYYVSIPYIKEYLARAGSSRSRRLDKLVDKVVNNVGVRQFEIFPIEVLARSSSPVIRYITAKKYFRVGQYGNALKALNGTIPRNHPIRPFALFLEASIFGFQKKYRSSIASYKTCVEETKRRMRRVKDENQLRQLAINRDYCSIGIARIQFAAGKYGKANLSYLDLPKDSFIWPEMLFEEAWNSFYQKDYNRALGKLVTYRAPVMRSIFNPEIEILKALSYMELCLWNDAQKTVNEFYKEYKRGFSGLQSFLAKHGKNYRFYYLLAKSYQNGKRSGNRLINRILRNITKDPAYIEIRDSLNKGKKEIALLKSLSRGGAKRVFTANLKETLLIQRNLVGAYVRKGIHIYKDQINSAFEGMSYINLEILGREKEAAYDLNTQKSEKRGDIKYLKRNERQYFWTFDEEFWADELGDYVFSLKSECGKEP